MTRSTTICNMAISHLGVGKTISDVDTGTEQEAIACRVFYDDALKKLYNDFPWPFASKVQALSLITTNPTNEWGYSYAYPTDCGRFNKIQSGTDFDNRQSRITYRVTNNGSQRVIYTDQVDAIGEFTEIIDDELLMSSDFKFAFSFLLAALIAPRLTKGDPFKTKNDMFNNYFNLISKAQANALNEEQSPVEPESEFIRGRE